MVQAACGNASGCFRIIRNCCTELWKSPTAAICNSNWANLSCRNSRCRTDETAFSYLWKQCFDGARQSYKPVTPEVLSRLTHELNVIEKCGLAPYFLLVWDIVEEAKRRGIPAVARGSAASSMVT